MIARLTGQLTEVHEHSVIIERQGLGYEVLVPGFAIGELAALRGREVQLFTMEFHEGNATGGNLVPRLVGFLHPEDKLFFNRFISVKGIGIRKALKALAEPCSKIAHWIKTADSQGLARLPGIGSRAAQLIIAELQDQVDSFFTTATGRATADVGHWSQPQRDALEVMVAWGDARSDVEQWLERAGQLHPQIESADEWVKACYRIKSGTEG